MNSIIVTKEKNKILYCAYIDGKLQMIEREDDDASFSGADKSNVSNVGDVFVGHVENISKTQHAAFVRYSEGDDGIGYLPFDQVIPESIICPKQSTSGACPDNALSIPSQNKAKHVNNLKCNDLVLVQIRNGKIKTKQADLTTYISIAGKYSVITRGKRGIGCSRKLESSKAAAMVNCIYNASIHNEDIDSAKSESAKEKFYKSSPYGIIIRTEAGEESVTTEDILDDIAYMNSRMDDMIKKAAFLTPLSSVYHKDGCDIMNEHVLSMYHFCRQACKYTALDDSTAIKCDNATLFEQLGQTAFSVSHPEVLIQYYDKEQSDLKTIYALKRDMDELSSDRVWLRSGAYIIIEKTEAMNVIDVNTGRSVIHGDDAFLKTNLEAAAECMRQIRLRNLSGMILIDFINMHDKESDKELINRLSELCNMETIRTTFVDITGLGIAEITRSKRI